MSNVTLPEMTFLYKAARKIAENGDLIPLIHSILSDLEVSLGFVDVTLAIIRDGQIAIQSADLVRSGELLRPALERVIHRNAPLSQAGFSQEKLIQLAPGMTMVTVPLIHMGKAAGALCALKRGIANRDELTHEVDFLSSVADLLAGTLLRRLQQEHSLSELQEENAELRRTIYRLEEQGRSSSIIGESPEIRNIFREIAQVAHAETTVLICGETGTGKELVARAIHEKSRVCSGPFVAINCGALPDSLLESELFGYEKGAFTGALASREGRFEEAHGGTLFLDEIGELSLEAQTRLLRVIQEKVVSRVGGGQPRPISVRLICATNRDLNTARLNGTFRDDLFYRINVFPITIPPLRQRQTDIPLIVEHFLNQSVRSHHTHGYEISKEVIRLLCEYPWPGNVRELGNTIERATLVTSTGKIGVEHLPVHLLPTVQEQRERRSLEYRMQEYEKTIIEEALTLAKGVQTHAAEFLNTTKRIIQYKIEKYHIDYQSFKPD